MKETSSTPYDSYRLRGGGTAANQDRPNGRKWQLSGNMGHRMGGSSQGYVIEKTGTGVHSLQPHGLTELFHQDSQIGVRLGCNPPRQYRGIYSNFGFSDLVPDWQYDLHSRDLFRKQTIQLLLRPLLREKIVAEHHDPIPRRCEASIDRLSKAI